MNIDEYWYTLRYQEVNEKLHIRTNRTDRRLSNNKINLQTLLSQVHYILSLFLFHDVCNTIWTITQFSLLNDQNL